MNQTNMVKCQICGKEIENEKKVQFVANLWRKFGLSDQIIAARYSLCQKCKMEVTCVKFIPTCIYITRNDAASLLKILNEKNVYT